VLFSLATHDTSEQLATIKYFQKHIYNTYVNNSVVTELLDANKITTIKQYKLSCFSQRKNFQSLDKIKFFLLDHYRIKEVLLLTMLSSFKCNQNSLTPEII